ncbi:polyprenyl synthetase family protein [Saccharopolyspora mangrovi]|uniref:Polyprenyl synthetase family protein n=1 Tax=Saccharopolyspora mangrovi TaxID=3082379 RepID=A0ABU6A567_9PSEU|nr:polyprenyl synthetase family protein [Saccharopolyspora sp. S2-29]MEB3366686.1 polyprenyl synthetase family protein [Saccharopolyspora sp. S2-29]
MDASLARFLDSQVRDAPDACVPPLVEVVRDFLAGGKRLRPLFAACGWATGGGDRDDPAAVRVGAALELFHAFALIHDDVMDSSDSRRGQPTVHRLLAGRAPDGSDAEHFGLSAAILLGDLCLVWSDELLHASGIAPERLHAARSVLNTMRTEIMAGQYLDLDVTAVGDEIEGAWRVVRQKTAAYTVKRPLQLGALLAGADEDVVRRCAEFGDPLGEAFQLRDDLLGVFGNEVTTGKPSDDDLRAGKWTVLMRLTWQRADASQRAVIEELHGSADLSAGGAQRLREIIRDTAADAEVEAMISARYERAVAALDVLAPPPWAEAALLELADRSTHRAR